MKTITVWKILQTNHPKLETQSEIPLMPPKLLIHITFCETSWFCKWMNRSMEVWQNDQRSLKVKYKPDFFAFFLLCNFIQATYSLYASISSPIKWELPRKIPILLWVQKKKRSEKHGYLLQNHHNAIMAASQIVQYTTYSAVPRDPAECSKVFNNRKGKMIYSRKEN